MATSTFRQFGDLPSELRLQVWRVFLDDEVRSRRVVVWDGRVMPFAHLASPLLRVNVETREKSLEFYSTKVDIYSLPDTGEFFPLNQDRLRQLAFEFGGEDNLPTAAVQDAWFAGDLSQRAHDLLESSQVISPTKGILYFNLERDTILHGYNCGVHLFVRKPSDIFQQDLENPAPLWRTFSSKVPVPAIQTARHVLRVQGPHFVHDILETSLFTLSSSYEDAVQNAWKPHSLAMDLAHPVLVLEEKESEDLMSHLSQSLKPLPGRLEAWFGWIDPTIRGVADIILVRFETEIEAREADFSATIRGIKDELAKLGGQGGETISSKEYQELKGFLDDYERGAIDCLRRMKDANTNVLARWREHWG